MKKKVKFNPEAQITTPSELRRMLGLAIVALMEGRINVSQANAMVGLSGEIHKSIRQEWDMRCYMAESLTYDQSEVVRTVLEHNNKDSSND